MPWIEIPQHRVLEVPLQEFLQEFVCLDVNGRELPAGAPGGEIYRIKRKRDDMLFIVPRFHIHERDFGRVVYLEPYGG